jgi:uncharacterized protein
MSPRHPLKIPVEEIAEGGEPFQVDDSLPQFAALLAEAGEGGDATGRAQLVLERWPQRVDVVGTLTAELSQTCVRCLRSYRQSIERDVFQILTRRAEGSPGAEEEMELHPGDLDRSSIVQGNVDLEALLAEEIQLALPLKPLCAEACKGICQGCGAELNFEPCTCEPETDPRWGALKGLRLKG